MVNSVDWPNFLYHPYPGTMLLPATLFVVAPKCVSVCNAAETELSNTSFINLVYVM